MILRLPFIEKHETVRISSFQIIANWPEKYTEDAYDIDYERWKCQDDHVKCRVPSYLQRKYTLNYDSLESFEEHTIAHHFSSEEIACF